MYLLDIWWPYIPGKEGQLIEVVNSFILYITVEGGTRFNSMLHINIWLDVGGVGSTLLHVVYAWYNLAKIEFESYKIILLIN